MIYNLNRPIVFISVGENLKDKKIHTGHQVLIFCANTDTLSGKSISVQALPKQVPFEQAFCL